MLLGSSCVVCGAVGAAVCRACERRLPPAANLPLPLHLDRCDARFAYGDEVSRLLVGLKNRQRRDLVGWLAGLLADAASPPAGTVVSWAPTSPARRRARGFDQAELLARALARRRGLPVRPLLARRPGPPQAGRTRDERRSNPSFEVRARPAAAVLLVDDVVTTGATLTAAARALRQAGCAGVAAAVVARA